jgi:decaprenylphospho-beta-D-erythro-pentofuranosid-2-ulose 2-reductase
MNERVVLLIGSTSTVGQALAAFYAKSGAEILLAGRDSLGQAALAADLRIRYGVIVRESKFSLDGPSSIDELIALYDNHRPHTIFFLMGWPGTSIQDLLDPNTVRQMTDVNYAGVASVIGAFMNCASFARGTRLVLIGSVAGDRGRAANPLYCAAKGALNIYAQGIRQLLYRQGVSVTLVKLGYVDSRLSYGLTPTLLTLSPEEAARRIHNASEMRKNIVYVPKWWGCIMFALRIIPEPIWKRLAHF